MIKTRRNYPGRKGEQSTRGKTWERAIGKKCRETGGEGMFNITESAVSQPGGWGGNKIKRVKNASTASRAIKERVLG